MHKSTFLWHPFYTIHDNLLHGIYHKLLKSRNFIDAKFYTITLCVVGNCIYFVAMCVLCTWLTLTCNSLQLTSNKEALMMEVNKLGERQAVVLKSKQLGLWGDKWSSPYVHLISVVSVNRSSAIIAIFKGTWSLTQEKNHSNAKPVNVASRDVVILTGTCAHTLERSLTSARYVWNHSANSATCNVIHSFTPSNIIHSFTLARKFTSVTTAKRSLHALVIWDTT